MSSTKCPQCGEYKKPEFDLCYNCSQKKRGDKSGPGRRSSGGKLPQSIIFASFYGKDGHLRREIFLDAAQEAAKLFEQDGLTQTSLRALFQMLKSMEQRIRSDKNIQIGDINETFLRFIRQVEYQTKREILKTDSFKKFVEAHQDIILDNKKEFVGFVEYFTSIMCRIRTK